MNRKKKIIFSITIIMLLCSILFNIIFYLNYQYHLEFHKRYDTIFSDYVGVIRGYLNSIERTLTDIISQNYMTYENCLFLSDVTHLLYADFNSFKRIFINVYFGYYKSYDPHNIKVFEAEWSEPYHDMLIPIHQLFYSTLSEFSKTDEQIEISELELITIKKLESIKDIISSINNIITNIKDEVNSRRITDLKHRIRVRFEQINEVNIFLKSKENYINSILKE